jgi:hypothetical protein
LSSKIAREIEKRRDAYLRGGKDEFVDLEDVLDAKRKKSAK